MKSPQSLRQLSTGLMLFLFVSTASAQSDSTDYIDRQIKLAKKNLRRVGREVSDSLRVNYIGYKEPKGIFRISVERQEGSALHPGLPSMDFYYVGPYLRVDIAFFKTVDARYYFSGDQLIGAVEGREMKANASNLRVLATHWYERGIKKMSEKD